MRGVYYIKGGKGGIRKETFILKRGSTRSLFYGKEANVRGLKTMECRLYQKYFLPYVNLYIK